MDIDYSELSDFVELAARLHMINPKIRPTTMVQPLARKGVVEYWDFVTEHHPSTINKEMLNVAFCSDEASISSGILVFVFFTWSLSDFINPNNSLAPSFRRQAGIQQ